MPPRTSPLVVLVFLLLLLRSGSAWADVTQEVHQVAERLKRALADGDADAVAALYAPDAELVIGGRPQRIEGRDAIRKVWKRAFHDATLRVWNLQERIRIYTPRTAGRSAFYTVERIDKSGKALGTSQGQTTMTLVKMDGEWLIVLHHTSVFCFH